MPRQWLRRWYCSQDHVQAAQGRPQRHNSLRVELLEDRVVPATLDLVGNQLQLNAVAGETNTVSISHDGTNFTITDSTNTITNNVAGFSGSGTNTITGNNAAITSFAL